MIIKAISDLHGRLPARIDCDLLLVGGDVCPDYLGKDWKYNLADRGAGFQLNWLSDTFRPWLQDHEDHGTAVVGIAGNHDFVFESMKEPIAELRLPWTYLLDEQVDMLGVSIYGTPWVPGLVRWAFYGSDGFLEQRANAIPSGIDILMSHGPPRGYSDFTSPQFGSMAVGDVALAKRIKRLPPPVVVCGHIHEGYGIYSGIYDTRTKLYNVAQMDENYDVHNMRPATTIWEVG